MLSDIERRLLQHYIEDERIISGRVRSQQHIRLLALGYIREDPIDTGNLLITVTRAGYAALDVGPGVA
jgi:hypothetical protein